MKKTIAILLAVVMVFALAACGKTEAPQKAEENTAAEEAVTAEEPVIAEEPVTEAASMEHPVVLADHLVDVGTITDVDEEYVLNYFVEKSLGISGGCTCVVAQVDGNNLLGRNMDLSLSENAAFKFVLDINEYKAIGIAYFPFMKGVVFDDVVANGVPEAARAILPYTATDFLNEAGLYIETNMRNAEEGYKNSGTNPDSDILLCNSCIPAYVATRCRTVDEAVELLKETSIYTSEASVPWNFCFTIADAEGNYGLLEIAKDKVSFLPGQNGQTNFYVTPEFAEGARFNCGESRYAVLHEGLDQITTSEQMLEHMEKAFYSQCYNADHLREAAFDIRSEFVHTFPVDDEGNYNEENGSVENCTTAWMTDDSRIDEVYDLIRRYVEDNYGKYCADGRYDFDAIRADAKNLPDFWVSAYSMAVDCAAKTMTVRFWEDTTNNLVFSFGE